MTIRKVNAALLLVVLVMAVPMGVVGAKRVERAEPEPVTLTEYVVVREALKNESCVQQIKRLAPIYGVPVDVAIAIHLHETAGGTVLYAEEPSLVERVNKLKLHAYDKKMMASAHGCFHMTGPTLQDYGLHWSAGYTVDGTEAALSKFRKALQASRGNVQRAICKHNGACKPSYVPSVLAQLPKARKLIANRNA